jgi:hypothetical protein
MESRSISLVLFAVTIASFARGQDGKQSQSVNLPIAARPVVSAALGDDIQRYGVRKCVTETECCGLTMGKT